MRRWVTVTMQMGPGAEWCGDSPLPEGTVPSASALTYLHQHVGLLHCLLKVLTSLHAFVQCTSLGSQYLLSGSSGHLGIEETFREFGSGCGGCTAQPGE